MPWAADPSMLHLERGPGGAARAVSFGTRYEDGRSAMLRIRVQSLARRTGLKKSLFLVRSLGSIRSSVPTAERSLKCFCRVAARPLAGQQ